MILKQIFSDVGAIQYVHPSVKSPFFKNLGETIQDEMTRGQSDSHVKRPT